MKKIVTLFYIYIISFSLANSQSLNDWCGSEEPKSFTDYVNSVGIDVMSDLSQINKENTYRVPIKWHIMNPNSTTKSTTLDRILDVMCTTNNYYDSTGIRFYLTDDVSFYNNANFYNLTTSGLTSTMMNSLNQANKINAFLVNLSNYDGRALCGFAYFPGSGPNSGNRQGGMVLSDRGDCFSSANTTITHELGHYFALPHPFQTTSNAPDNPATAERVTRLNNEIFPRMSANCSSAGDRFCDTDADYIATRWNCNQITHTQLDANGDLFKPNRTFFMSYSLDNCQTRFSPQQTATMIFAVTNLRAYLLSGNLPNTFQPVSQLSTLQTPTFLETVPRNVVPFNWTAVPNATKYLLQVSSSPNFSPSTILLDTIVSSNSFVFNATNRFLANPNQVYRWRVKGFNDAYTCGAFAVPSGSQGAFYLGFGVNTTNLGSSKFSVFPTLLSNFEPIQIRLKDPNIDKITISVIDVNGKLVYRQEISERGQIATSLQLPASLQKGIYLLRIASGNEISNHKIVLQ